MTTPLSVVAMIAKQTAAQILAIGLEVATAVGLPVTSWRAGDPSRTQFKYLARVLESLEDQNSEFIKAGFLRDASGDWLRIKAEDDYGVTPGDATYATPTVTLTNTGTRHYNLAAGDLVTRSSVSGKTYHSTQAGTWVGGTALPITFIADEEGSASSVGVNEIDELITTFLGLTITASTASIAVDAQDDDSIKTACEDSRGALSPDGPADAYAFVVKNPALTGNVEITRAETDDDSDTLRVTVYVAGNAGPVSAAALTAGQNAVERWATPLTVRPTVANAAALPTPLNAQFSGELPEGWQATVSEAWNTLINTYAIGRTLTLSTINKALRTALPEADNCVLVTPAADVVPATSQVITVGSVTLTQV